MNTPAPEEPKESVPKPGTSDDGSILNAFHSIFGIAPRFAGAVIGLAAVGYFVGWRTAISYYNAFGAGWIVSLLSATELLQRSYKPLLGIVVGILASMYLTLRATATRDSVARVNVLTSAIALLAIVLWLVLRSYIGLIPASYLASVATILLSLALGYSIAHYAFALRERTANQVWPSLRRLHALVLFASLFLPMVHGQSRGALAASPELSRLPLVTVGSATWRLLLARSDRCVLVSLEKGKQPVLRIVPYDTIDRIHEYTEQEAESLGGAQRASRSQQQLDAGGGQ